MFILLSCFAFYLIVRKAVKDGVLDADDTRREREHTARLREQVRTGRLSKPPES